MRLVTARLVLDRVSLHPTPEATTRFFENNTAYTLTTTRRNKGITAILQAQGMEAPFERELDPDDTPTEQAEHLAEWIVFVVNMTLSIRELTTT